MCSKSRGCSLGSFQITPSKMTPSGWKIWLFSFFALICWAKAADDKVTNFVKNTIINLEGLNKDLPMEKLRKCYDIIIVGATSPGCVLANRLSEFPCWNVLLITKGGDETTLSKVPFHYEKFTSDSKYRTLLKSDGSSGDSSPYKTVTCAIGNGLGGSSSTDSMIYARGCASDYDSWEALGNVGWDWEKVLPYFLKSERAKGDFANSGFHSSCGIMDVERSPTEACITQAFIDAAIELGFVENDYNSGIAMGVSKLQYHMKNGQRVSSNDAFLTPIATRRNLHIVQQADMQKLLICDKKVTGIVFRKKGVCYTVHCKKEVILCDGAIFNPQILMVSGIGPRDELESLGIPVIQELPGVGKHLMYQYTLPLLSWFTDANCTIPGSTYALEDTSVLTDYITKQEGFLTAPDLQASVYATSSIAEDNCPDLQLLLSATFTGNDVTKSWQKHMDLEEQVFQELFGCNCGKDGFLILISYLKPLGLGSVHVQSRCMTHNPRIKIPMFKDERELTALVDGVKIALKMGETKALKQYGAVLNENILSVCGGFKPATDDYYFCGARRVINRVYGFAGTCKMGNDTMAVVDSNLNVRGIKRLRIVDSSIMPTRPSTTSSDPGMMIAEKAAVVIKETYRGV